VTFFALGALRSRTQLALVSHDGAARRPLPAREQLPPFPLRHLDALRSSLAVPVTFFALEALRLHTQLALV
jgi:hypothetical protein